MVGVWDVTVEDRLESDVGLIIRRAYPMELYASLDLALWPPLVPTGMIARYRKFTWKDIHPGHRFVKVRECLQSTKRTLSMISGEDRNKQLEDFQRLTCAETGWPTQTELIQIWLDDNDQKRQCLEREDCRLMSITFESEGHSRLKIVDRVLRKRLEFYCDLVISNITEPQIGVSQLGWMLRNDDGLYRITEIEKRNWDISPSILRAVIMTRRYLLLGERYRGDQPQNFVSRSVTDALYLVCSLLRSNKEQFRCWTQKTPIRRPIRQE